MEFGFTVDSHKALFNEIQQDMHELLEEFGVAMRTQDAQQVEGIVGNIQTSIQPSIQELRKRGSSLRRSNPNDVALRQGTRDREQKLEVHASRLRGACYKFLGHQWDKKPVPHSITEEYGSMPPESEPRKRATDPKMGRVESVIQLDDDKSAELKEGDRVYRNGQPCTIIKIDSSMEPPSYIVHMEDADREVNTELSRLTRTPQGQPQKPDAKTGTKRAPATEISSAKGKVPWIRNLFPSGSDAESDERPDDAGHSRISEPPNTHPRGKSSLPATPARTYTHETQIDRDSNSSEYPDVPLTPPGEHDPDTDAAPTTTEQIVEPASKTTDSLNTRLSRIMSAFKTAQKQTSIADFDDLDVNAMGLTEIRKQIADEKEHVEKLRTQLRNTRKQSKNVSQETGSIQSLVANFRVRQQAASGPHKEAHRNVQTKRLQLQQLPATMASLGRLLEEGKSAFQKDIQGKLAALVNSQNELQQMVEGKRTQIAELQQSLDNSIYQERNRYVTKKQDFMLKIQKSQQRLASESVEIMTMLGHGQERLHAEQAVLEKEHQQIVGRIVVLRSSLEESKDSMRGHAQMLVDKRSQLDALGKHISSKQEHCQNVIASAAQHVADLESIREPVQLLFDEAGRALQEARDRLQGVSNQELQEVCRMTMPEQDVLACFTMAFRLIGRGEIKWRTMKNELRKPRQFKKQLLEFDPEQIRINDRDVIKKFLKDPKLMTSKSLRQYKLCGAILTWLRAQVELAQARETTMTKLVHINGEILAKTAQRDVLKRTIGQIDSELLECAASHKHLSEEYLEAKTGQQKQLHAVSGVESSLMITQNALKDDITRVAETYKKLQVEHTDLENKLKIETPVFDDEDAGPIGIYSPEETSSTQENAHGLEGFIPIHLRKDVAELREQLNILEDKMSVNAGSTNGRDEDDDEAVQVILEQLRQSIEAAKEEVKRSPKTRASIDRAIRMGDFRGMQQMYEIALKRIKREPGWPAFVNQARERASTWEVRQTIHQLELLFRHGLVLQPRLQKYLESIAETTSGQVYSRGVKRMYRALEKSGMQQSKLCWTTFHIFDVCRASIKFDTIGDLLEAYKAFVDDERIEVKCIVNRFLVPDARTGWADVLFCMSFTDDHLKLIMEVALVHTKMVCARRVFGSHSEWAKYRNCVELRQLMEDQWYHDGDVSQSAEQPRVVNQL